MGDYLGGFKPANAAARKAYAALFDFEGTTFVAGLREFLDSFRLPGPSPFGS